MARARNQTEMAAPRVRLRRVAAGAGAAAMLLALGCGGAAPEAPETPAPAAAAVVMTPGPGDVPAKGDWPAWRGARRDGVAGASDGPAARDAGAAWAGGSVRVAWRRDVGVGYASVAVVGDRVWTVGNLGDEDVLWCLDALDGAAVWRDAVPCYAAAPYPGPRATPTVADGRVFALTRDGLLRCLEAATGRRVWALNVADAVGAARARWGFASSPLVAEGLVVVDVGPLVAVRAATGEVAWSAAAGDPGYASPVLVDGPDGPRVAGFSGFGVRVVTLADGRPVGRVRWRTSYDANVATPLVLGRHLLVTSGYGVGCGLLAVKRDGLEAVWTNRALRSHVATPVAWNGYVYGFDGQVGPGAALVCVDPATGRRVWAVERFGSGSLIVAGGRLVVLTAEGELVAADASPAGYTERGRTRVLDGPCWTPAAAAGALYVRTTAGRLVKVVPAGEGAKAAGGA